MEANRGGHSMDHQGPMKSDMNMKMTMKSGYRSLAVQTIVSAIIMYLVMFVMIDRLSSFYNNLNMVYMTAMMVVLMVIAMKDMFPSKTINAALLIGSAIAFFGGYALIRTQTTIGDTSFLRSMIPHHSGAILMCEKANLRDPQVKALCSNIIKSQREEIAQMEAMLANR